MTSKYGNRKTVVDGQVFDSRKEASRYTELRLMERAGEIRNLQRQIPFELIPTQYIRGRKHKPIRYIADFTYLTKDGRQIVEDAKGCRTPIYIIKMRMMLWMYGIEVYET